MKTAFFVIIIGLVLSNDWSGKKTEFQINFGQNVNLDKYLENASDVKSYEILDRSDLEKIRQNSLLTGIVGREVKLKFNLSEGSYKIIAYLEAGMTDSTYLSITANGSPLEFQWQSFSPPAEPRTNIQEIYRIVNMDIDLADSQLALNFLGEADDIRLLNIYVFPLSNDYLNPPESLSKMLFKIGIMDSEINSEEIREFISSRNGESGFDHYINMKLEEFALAIDLYDMMGWEKGRAIYGLSIFARLYQSVSLLDGIIGDDWLDDYLGERARFLRGRLLWWLNKERGGAGELATAIEDLNYLLNLYPKNELLKMYTGSKIDSPDKFDTITFPKNAPEWSKLQFEALGRLLSETNWWVNKRQSDNGELGGKIGDDVEILRWWSALAAYGDKITIKGWLKLGEAVWNNPKLFEGYSAKPIDVEHSSEFIADTYPEMIYFSNEDAKKYLEPSARYFKDLWTFKNKNNRRYFKSSWFSSTEVVVDPPKDRDLSMNGRAVKAVRFYAWTTTDTAYRNALYEWSCAWRDIALSNKKNKPIGIFPASVRGSDEEFNGDGKNWYDAEMFWQYFDWVSSGGVRFYDQLLYSFITHDDATLLLPLKKTLELVKKYSDEENNFPIGSEGWAAKIIESKYRFWNAVVQYRILTQDKSFDDLITKYGSPYSKFIITKNKDYLVYGLDQLLNEIRYNVPLRTSEVIHTDRVRVSDIITLKGMITGNDSYEIDSPFLAITYENTTPDITMLVAESNKNKIEIDFYSYSDSYLTPIVRPWLLKNGKHKLTKYVNQEIVNESEVDINIPGKRLEIKLPPKKEVKLIIEKI